MATTLVRTEPLGIVVQDGGQTQTVPRILMWYWASESDIPEWEKD